jgi:hypothetical protein
VRSFHHNTVAALAQILAAAGLDHPAQLRPQHLVRRISQTRVQQFSDVHTFLEPDELLAGTVHRFYGSAWKLARAESFAPAT